MKKLRNIGIKPVWKWETEATRIILDGDLEIDYDVFRKTINEKLKLKRLKQEAKL